MKFLDISIFNLDVKVTALGDCRVENGWIMDIDSLL